MKRFITYCNVLLCMAITGKIRKKSSGHRYVTIPKDEEQFSEGDHVIIKKVEE